MIGLLDYFLSFPSSSQKAQRHPENKSVLILGAGYVSLPVVEYLAKSKNTEVTVGKYVKVTWTGQCKNQVRQLYTQSDNRL